MPAPVPYRQSTISHLFGRAGTATTGCDWVRDTEASGSTARRFQRFSFYTHSNRTFAISPYSRMERLLRPSAKVATMQAMRLSGETIPSPAQAVTGDVARRHPMNYRPRVRLGGVRTVFHLLESIGMVAQHNWQQLSVSTASGRNETLIHQRQTCSTSRRIARFEAAHDR